MPMYGVSVPRVSRIWAVRAWLNVTGVGGG